MKRDLDLVRKILVEVESYDITQSNTLEMETIEIDDYPKTVVVNHVRLLIEAGLLVDRTQASRERLAGKMMPVLGQGIWLTWKGHEFLNDIKNDNAWSAARQTAASIGGAGLEFVWEMAKGYVRQRAIESGVPLG